MVGGVKEAITVRLDAERRAELDAVAQAMSRDRSYVVNEAIASYLAVHRWQVAHIAEGLRQAEAGEFATNEEVDQAFAR